MNAYINSSELLCCAGDKDALMKAIYEKRTGVSIDTSYMSDTPVALGMMEYNDFYQLGIELVKKILDDSNLDDFHNTLLIVGSSVGGMRESEKSYFKKKNYKNIDPNKHAISVISDSLMEEFGFLDSRSISTACTSSANALLLAKRLINVEAYKNILVFGADALCYTTVCGFNALGVLSSKICRPFDKDRDGMNVAEAIAGVLVQNVKCKDSVELKGVGASSDAFHITNPDPEAKGAMKSMLDSMKDAGILAEQIDYINAHGTGTLANDNVESLAVQTLLPKTFISSTKAITGHTLGAAGALEAIISCEVIKRGLVPPQSSLQDAQNGEINLSKTSVKKDINYVISNSFAFGGNNTSLIFGVVK